MKHILFSYSASVFLVLKNPTVLGTCLEHDGGMAQFWHFFQNCNKAIEFLKSSHQTAPRLNIRSMKSFVSFRFLDSPLLEDSLTSFDSFEMTASSSKLLQESLFKAIRWQKLTRPHFESLRETTSNQICIKCCTA